LASGIDGPNARVWVARVDTRGRPSFHLWGDPFIFFEKNAAIQAAIFRSFFFIGIDILY
jgi:hypothetical protein